MKPGRYVPVFVLEQVSTALLKLESVGQAKAKWPYGDRQIQWQNGGRAQAELAAVNDVTESGIP